MPDNQHPGNDYYVNLVTGTIQRQGNKLAGDALIAAGFAGPYPWKDAVTLSHNKKGREDILNHAGPSGAQLSNTANGVSDTLSGIARVGDVLQAFYENITDGKMWRSLGWLVLGLVFIIGGVVLWMKNSNLLPDVVPIPV